MVSRHKFGVTVLQRGEKRASWTNNTNRHSIPALPRLNHENRVAVQRSLRLFEDFVEKLVGARNTMTKNWIVGKELRNIV